MTLDNLTGSPDMLPPVDALGASTSTSSDSAPSTEFDEPGLTVGEVDSGPSLQPPEALAAGADDDGVTAATWHSVKIDALWSIEETRNAWLRIAGGAWKRIYNGRDGSFQALVTLASQARQTGRTAQIREESDGMIYEIYLW
ncbi:hypothetical protein FNH13_07980 [Ornithinimicrobium ciconiae]|uniref:Uncharacterized protein n=1 Tax=Ornithinimicrobium ciconiae TaxID=2594265 RepID=A0A516G9U4_9MICO|nr:hypothetical protein [Ornithinimicrobium ciconiae]QDO88293.1 hypothetical protein FNH13_07980 [Ornithinimicrobium ciconiae]